MSTRIWHSGPPPYIGWWNASNYKDVNAWRWWDGEYWSIAMYKEDTLGDFRPPTVRVTSKEQIQWTDHWPENARVPRVAP